LLAGMVAVAHPHGATQHDFRRHRLVVEMTLTTPGCPVSESLPDQAAAAVADALGPGGAARVELRVVWDPRWTPERLSADAASRLGRRR
jgi:metal-sulfur cluster biosynthetic enzyme